MTGVQSQTRRAAEDRDRVRRGAGDSLQPRRHGEIPKTEARGKVEPIKPAKAVVKPAADADLAFLPLHQLAELIRSEEDLVHRTDEALSRATEEIRPGAAVRRVADRGTRTQAGGGGGQGDRGREVPRAACTAFRGWRRTSIAYPGYKTTWGAGHFKDQTIDTKATVAANAGRGRGGARREDHARVRWRGATSGSAA